MTSEATAAVRIPPASEVFEDEGLRRAAAAAERGDVAQIRALGPLDLDAVSASGANLLMYEIATRNETAVRALLDAGADPNHLTPEGASPMMAAGISDDPRWLGLLLDKGGDPNLRAGQGRPGEPLLTLLVAYGRWENMLVLLDRGADIEATGPSGQTAALRLAALYQFERVDKLLERGADPAHPDVNGLTLRAFVAHTLPPDSPQEPSRRRVAERIGLGTPHAADVQRD
jgi:uncharacterized protein